MTKDILSGKKKFLAFVIAVIINGLNDVLGLNLSHETLEAATYIGGGLVAVEGILDIVRALSNHFLKKNAVTITTTTGSATTAISQGGVVDPVTDVEKTYHGE